MHRRVGGPSHGKEQSDAAEEPRAVARRVPGLEGVEGKLRLEIEGKAPRVLAIHDGLIEPLQQADEQVDATIVFDGESCLDELLAATQSDCRGTSKPDAS